MANLSLKERMAIPRQAMPEQEAGIRASNFLEVPLGFSDMVASTEASRCLECKDPKCVQGCPVNINIPGFLKEVAEGNFAKAAEVIRETNFLPAICGRVCPQDQQCEFVCVVGKQGEAISIGSLERFVSDYERTNGLRKIPDIAPSTGKRVAVVGAGPAGLTAAYELARRGHAITIYEAFHRAGGVLVYGIPRFRLPLEIIDEDIGFLKKMGVEFVYNTIIGKSIALDELLGAEFGYDAVFVGTGAGLPKMLGIKGENLNGIYSANEYLTRIYLMGADNFPNHATPLVQGQRVAIIGAGNTAMDAARTAKRLGSEVTVYYRRSQEEAPARREELHHAMQEGIAFKFLANPIEFVGNDDHFVIAISCEAMSLSEPDSSGRKRPLRTGHFFTDPVDTVIFSLGCDVNPLIADSTPDLRVDETGVVYADPKTCQTSKEGVFAGGDITTGGAKVITAMGQAKVAAAAIHDYVMRER